MSFSRVLSILFILVPIIRATTIDKSYLKSVFKNLNSTADPCVDFYEYACGNWVSNYASEHYLDMPGHMEQLVNEQLLQVIKENKNETGIYKMLWRYYKSCVELTSPAHNYYLKLVEPELQFQWPIFRANWSEEWQNETDFDWLSTIAHLRVYGLNSVFLSQNINVRLSNGSHYLLELHQHQLRLELRLDNILNIFRNFGMSEEQSQNVSSKVMELEERMNNLTSSSEIIIETEEDDKRYMSSFKEMTVEELVKSVPQIDWIKYLSIILERPVDEKREIVQTFGFSEKYFDELLEILKETSNETICHYVMLKLIYHLNDDLPDMKDKTMFCVKHLRGYMPLAMNFLYEKHFYKARRNATDAALMKIFEGIRRTFEDVIEENFLELNSTEKAFILDELRTMRLKVGNIPENVGQDFVEEYYANISVNESSFYKNHLQLLKLHTRRQQRKLRNLPIPASLEFYEHDAETSSSSSPVKIFENAILVPYGYLQLPLFDATLNPLLQYSLFGFIIAHEIVHAYDLFHIVYDRFGNYNEVGVAVSRHFWQYVDCFARHPSDNLSENIADVAGLRLVYKTFFDDANNLHDGRGRDVIGKAFNMTDEQLFFINSVQFLCANMEKISAVHTNSLNLGHDMHDVRVQWNWANFEPFAIAFQCENDTIMNPETKCRLW